jgi:hypothetical protein
MAYSNKLDPSFKEYIVQLEQSNEAIEWQSVDPAKLAYKIREALHAYKNDELKAKFVIKVLPGKVRAIPRFRNTTEIVKEKLAKMVLSDVSDLFEILGATIQHKSTNRELYFPNAVLDDEDTKKLWLWCSANGFYVVKGEGITLTTEDPGMVAWKPL